MICCGFDRTTPYCCTCGKKLGVDDSWESLRSYCNERHTDAVDALRAAERSGNDAGRVERARYKVERWEGWIRRITDALSHETMEKEAEV